jgi:hypothetical protein
MIFNNIFNFFFLSLIIKSCIIYDIYMNLINFKKNNTMILGTYYIQWNI